MPLRPQLLAEIRAALTAATSTNLTTASAAYDLFEAYVWSIMLNAARTVGATVTLYDVHGNVNPVPFVFRTSPGRIFSQTNPYGYAEFSFANKPALEAHVGVFVSGKSGVQHECDVVILEKSEAETCRINNVQPRASKVVCSVECKWYTSGLRLHLAREFMGLGIEFKAGNCYFVSNASSRTIEKLLSHHKRQWERNVYPGSDVAVAQLQGLIQKSLQYYIAKV